MGVEVDRTGADRAGLAKRHLRSRAMVRQPPAVERIIAVEFDRSPHWQMTPTSSDDGTTLQERFVRMVGAHKRVLLEGDLLAPISRELEEAGCSVSTADRRDDRRRPAALTVGAVAPVLVERHKRNGRRYDVVGLHGVLDYVDDPVAVLNGFRRQLTDEGYVVAVIPNPTHGSIRLRMLSGRAPADWTAIGRAPARFYDAPSIKRLFEQAGFAIVRFERQLQPFNLADSQCPAPLTPEFASELMRDGDALTSAFVVMAYASPLNGRASLELRVRDLAETQGQHRRALEELRNATAQPIQRAQIEHFDQRLLALSGQVSDIKGLVDKWRDDIQVASQSALRTTRETITARIAEMATIDRDLDRLQYEQLVGRIRTLIQAVLPPHSIVLVVSKGDSRLTDLPHHTGWHFLRTAEGLYAGHHPANSAAAVEALEQLRSKGAGYLVFPQTAFWWFDHYRDFKRHLDDHFRLVTRDDRTAVVYQLHGRSRRS